MSNYPPGVTGNEPQITGIWPCQVCGGAGYDDENEDGKHTCGWCKGQGDEPEDPDLDQVRALNDHSNKAAREFVFRSATEWLDRYDEWTRNYLRECLKIVRIERHGTQMTFATDDEINRSFDAYR